VTSEQIILCGIMNGTVAVDMVNLDSDEFLERRHSNLYSMLRTRHRARLPLDLPAVIQHLIQSNSKECGELVYISSIGDQVSFRDNIEKHIRQVREKAQAHRLQQAVAGIQARLKSQELDSEGASVELIAEASMVQDLHTPTLEEVVAGVAANLDAEAGGKRQVYMPSGVPEIDQHPDFMGLSRDGVSLILAASGMGKTSFLNAIALGLLKQRRSVYLHGSETSPARRMRDLLFTLARVDGRAWAMQTRQLGELMDSDPLKAHILRDVTDWRDRLRLAQAWLKNADLHLTGSGLSAEQVSATARRLRMRGKAEVVLVDYLQDLSPSKSVKAGDRVAQVGYSSGVLKALSADLHIPVIVAAQVSGEKQGQKPAAPPLAGCQWSSTCHQDAEEVLSLYRPDYYRDRGQNADGPEGVVQVVARKRRTGRLSTLSLPWDGPTKQAGRPHIRL
jgi:replicative DNA helicase